MEKVSAIFWFLSSGNGPAASRGADSSMTIAPTRKVARMKFLLFVMRGWPKNVRMFFIVLLYLKSNFCRLGNGKQNEGPRPPAVLGRPVVVETSERQFTDCLAV